MKSVPCILFRSILGSIVSFMILNYRSSATAFCSSSSIILLNRQRIRHRQYYPSLYSTFESEISNKDVSPDHNPLVYAKIILKRMSSERTLQRLTPVFDLAVHKHDNKISKTCVDVGCDHGLLAISLGASGIFDKVVGVDVSEQALQNGALVNFDRVKALVSTLSNIIPAVFPDIVSFRVGDGLKGLNLSENTTVCICGMGVHRMIDIIFLQDNVSKGRVCTKYNRFVLQPTNSKPRNLMAIYDKLQRSGYIIHEEHIEFISSRFYVTTSFTHTESSGTDVETRTPHLLPGEWVLQNAFKIDEKAFKHFQDYVTFHREWIEGDKKYKPKINAEDDRWLEFSQKCNDNK